jgi:hypothetical protein
MANSLTALVAVALLVAISSVQGRGGAGPSGTRQAQACDPARQSCCFTPDGRAVPPGYQHGPYVCLPNGTWG